MHFFSIDFIDIAIEIFHNNYVELLLSIHNEVFKIFRLPYFKLFVLQYSIHTVLSTSVLGTLICDLKYIY